MSFWTPGWQARPPQDGDLLLVLEGNGILKPDGGWLLDWGGVPADDAVSIGHWQGRPVYVTGSGGQRVPGASLISLRDAMLTMDDAPAEMLSTAFQVHQWWRDHVFCGRCGTVTGLHPGGERARWCDTCDIPWYPRIAPCIITVIRRDDQILLARSVRAKSHFYSLIAGFVEPGETLEQAVAREVLEETGLQVSNIRYQGSQPWPFPHQLMLGFFADYLDGELVLQEDELADAGWYRAGELPPIPPATTIAGRMINRMLQTLDGKEVRL